MRGRIRPVEVRVDGQAHRIIFGGSEGRGLPDPESARPVDSLRVSPADMVGTNEVVGLPG
ncbi:MAG: hypothetical protein QOC73_2172 [Actinomycetota bacterium]|nr:hypothetical protein [Actinomycetota bacterium]MDQ1540306.1 hypothetical protein [Actinomycetota bacterium]